MLVSNLFYILNLLSIANATSCKSLDIVGNEAKFTNFWNKLETTHGLDIWNPSPKVLYSKRSCINLTHPSTVQKGGFANCD